MLNSSNPPSEQYNYRQGLQRLQQLINRYPLAFWGTIWGVLLLIITLATLGLVNPGGLEEEKSLPKPLVSTTLESTIKKTPQPKSLLISPRTQSPPQEGLPLSLFLGLALGCAAGSLLLTYTLRQSPQRSQIIKSSQSSRYKKRQHSTKPRNVPQNPKSVGHKQALESRQSSQILSQTENPEVTILSDQEKNPLDREEQTLAEMLDLRKRESLASIMQRSLSRGKDISLTQTSSYSNGQKS